MDYKIHRFNNMMIITVKKPFATDCASVRLTYNVGSLSEGDQATGIAHFLEHCVFLGSKATPSRSQVENLLMSFGGDYNAFTTDESTTYELKGFTTDINRMVQTLREITESALITDDDSFARERDVVIAEFNDTLGADGSLNDLDDVLFKAVTGRQPVLGSLESIQALTADEIRRFKTKHYRAAEACFIVTSSLDHSTVVESLAELTASALSAPVSAKPERRPLPLTEGVRQHAVAAVKSSDGTFGVAMNFLFLPATTPKEFCALEVLKGVLFYGELSLLFGRLRQEGLLYDISGDHDDIADFGLFEIRAKIERGNIEAFAKILTEQIGSCASGLFSDTFFQLIKNHVSYSLVEQFDDLDFQQEFLEKKYFLNQPAFTRDESLEALAGLTKAAVQTMCLRVFKTPLAAAAVAGKQAAGPARLIKSVLKQIAK